jgi:hypothetical protein
MGRAEVSRPPVSMIMRVARLADTLDSTLGGLGSLSIDLSENAVLAAAVRRTRLRNWGDEHFRVPLRALLESHRDNRDLTLVGRIMARNTLVKLVSNRLRINNDLDMHPEILSGNIVRPVFVLGIPRSGTTFLHRLLAQDPRSRSLLFWEALSPSPPPTPETYSSDPRIRAAERTIAMLYRALPGLDAIHHVDPKGPEECLGLLMNTFVTPFFRGRLPQYREWLDRIDDAGLALSYREYREQLLLLQWKIPTRHWVLKCPSHLFGLKALLATFPDARVIQTHRDPLKAIPSLCSLANTLSALSVRSVDPTETGAGVVAGLEQILNRSMAVRDEGDGGRVYDVHYRSLVNDPMGTVQKIYEYFGSDVPDAMRDNINEYVARDRMRSEARHHYTLDQFGLDSAEITRRFSAYAHRFRIESE